LAQGRKRIGLIVGAGAPAGILVEKASGKIDPKGESLIPAIEGLTKKVLGTLDANQTKVVQNISADLGPNPNIEKILSKIRTLASVLGASNVHGSNGDGFKTLGKVISTEIGKVVNVLLPQEVNPYVELAGWIGGTDREHAIEVFTPNYDLLLEEAFERGKMPFFDGFSGSVEPFFDASSTAKNDMPARWTRLWKLHGSLGWKANSNADVIRNAGRDAAELIYPDHLKYDQINKLPYTAFFDRLRKFLMTPDTLLLTCGFSFFDAHISAVVDEALGANATASVFAFQFKNLLDEGLASTLARKRPNLSVYAKDGAVIRCVGAPWMPGELPSKDWGVIREKYWGVRDGDSSPSFLLGDFTAFARFFALSHAEQIEPAPPAPV
jgi:hypothetical protein